MGVITVQAHLELHDRDPPCGRSNLDTVDGSEILRSPPGMVLQNPC